MYLLNGIAYPDEATAQKVAVYLQKGMDQPTAEYYASGRKKIVSVAPSYDYTLLLRFDNGETRRYDCKPLFGAGSAFEAFRDPDAFNRVYLDDCHCVSWDIDPNIDSEIVWNNKVDLCPDSCYIDSQPVST
jgi:hypothetical protein